MSEQQREDAAPFTELVYDSEALPWFREQWPEATFTDASDFIHEGRFEVSIPGVTSDDAYPLIIAEGWSGCCLGFGLCLRLSERRDDVHRWIDQAKALLDVSVSGGSNAAGGDS